MVKQDIVSRVAQEKGITKVKAEIAVDAFFDSLKSAHIQEMEEIYKKFTDLRGKVKLDDDERKPPGPSPPQGQRKR